MVRYFREEPFGSYRDNIHAGLIASTFANAFRKKGTSPVSYQDFMLMDRNEHRKRQSQKFIGMLGKLSKPKKKHAKTR